MNNAVGNELLLVQMRNISLPTRLDYDGQECYILPCETTHTTKQMKWNEGNERNETRICRINMLNKSVDDTRHRVNHAETV